MNDSDKLQYLFDRTLIVDVITRFATSLDMRDWVRFRSCFADVVEFDYPYVLGSVTLPIAELIKLSPSFFNRLDATQHISANHQVEIDGNSAVCISTLFAQSYLKDFPGGSVHRQIGYYRNFLKKADQWRIHRSEQLDAWQEGNERVVDHAKAPLRDV
jgi:hypothetical protein